MTQTAITKTRATKSTRKYNNHATKQSRYQHKTPHKSEENQAMDKEVCFTIESTIYSMQHLSRCKLYCVEINLPCLVHTAVPL